MKKSLFLSLLILPLIISCKGMKSEADIRKAIEAEYQHKIDSMKLAEAERKLAEAEAYHSSSSSSSTSSSSSSSSSSSVSVSNCEYSWLVDHRLTYEEMSGYSLEDLAIYRNAIYAMKGRKFVKAKFQRHFAQFSWYHPRYTEVSLNSLEKANVMTIKQVEEDMGGPLK